MRAPSKALRRYLLQWLVSCLLISGTIFSLNWLIDPLWHHGGTQIQDVNYAYNERLTKMHRFLNHLEDYDCIIFGSSVSTVFNAIYFKDHQCFNFAFSAGAIEEFVVYAEYIKQRGFEPKQVYVEINNGLVPSKDLSLNRIPEFIRNGTEPKSAWKNYLSIDSFVFSLKSLIRRSPYMQVYDRDFVGRVRTDVSYTYAPTREQTRQPITSPEPTAQMLGVYQQLRDVFPNAKYTGYVWPVSPWFMTRLHNSGRLHTILNLTLDLAKTFDETFDFSIPSDITSNVENSYDGFHYYSHVFAIMARQMERNENGFGLEIHTPEQYKKTYLAAFNNFTRQNKL